MIPTTDPVEAAGTSRRTLLKGAVGVGVGAAVYSSPVVSPVPAYATHGLSTWTVASNVLCVWFSPNHDDDYGDWHPGFTSVANVYTKPAGVNDHGSTVVSSTISFATPFTVGYTVGGVNRQVRFGGHPNNFRTNTSTLDQLMDTYTGTPVVNPGDGYSGGGIKIQLLDPNCEFYVLGIKNFGKDNGSNTTGSCSEWGNDNDADTSGLPNSTSWANGNSSQPITPSNPPNGAIANPWQGDATRVVYYHTGQERKETGKPWSMFFKIRCR